MKDQLRGFITAHMMNNPDYPLQDDEALITGGLVDSFSLVELALFVEENFGLAIDDADLNADNMNTLNSIVNFIEAQQ